MDSNINWFPGHMAKSIKKLKEITKFIDFFSKLLMPELLSVLAEVILKK